MRRSVAVAAGLLTILVIGSVSGASAHPLAPSLLEIRELPDRPTEVIWKTPLRRPTGVEIRPVLPARCRRLAPPVMSSAEGAAAARWMVDCGTTSLAGDVVAVRGLRESRTAALVRVILADGRRIRVLLRADRPSLRIPERESPLAVARSHLGLGVEHLLRGLDHVLFVVGLVLLVRSRRSLLLTVTAFTLGHSLTLALAVLGIVHVPTAPVEVAIAVSILLLAAELSRRGEAPDSWFARPAALALPFGLLHGLGFAGALAEIGLPEAEIPLALFSFNVGIEVGQLFVVALALGIGAALRPLAPRLPLWSGRVPAYAIGSLAGFWVFERAAALF